MEGEYIAELVVSSKAGKSKPDTVVITVNQHTENSVPIANAGNDQEVTQGDTVSLDGSASHDPDGDVITYSWSIITLPGGSASVLSDPGSSSSSFTADTAGT